MNLAPRNTNKTSKYYYPGGFPQPGRSYNPQEYRFGGAGGQEADDEITGGRTHYTAPGWEYDSRILRRWNVDPRFAQYPGQSPYLAFNGNPIIYNDPTGEGGVLTVNQNRTGTIKMRVVLYSDVVDDVQLNAMKTNLQSTIKDQLSQTYTLRTNNGSSTMTTWDVNVTFDIEIEVLDYESATKEASGNKSVANNYFYVGDFETPEGNSTGGFQRGNAGIISKDATSETGLHEIMFTLGFYTEKGQLHQHPGNPKSLLFAGNNDMSGGQAQQQYKQTILKEDMNNLTNPNGRGSNVPDPYYKKQTKGYGEKTNQTYDAGTATKVMNMEEDAY